jgi:hypothetical protein
MNAPKNNDDQQGKKAYTPPVLTEYGKVSKLTESGGTSATNDHGGNHMYT